MCDFFSFVTEGDGILRYFDWKQRQLIVKGELLSPTGQSVNDTDSHSQICSYYDLNCDKVNKYEYNFLTKKFKIDQINLKHKNDSKICKESVMRLRVKKIIEPLIIKKIVNPIEMKKRKINIDEAIVLLKQWDAVVNAVGDAVSNAVWSAMRDAVGVTVWDTMRKTVVNAVWKTVQKTMWNAMWAYVSSFFNIKYKYDFSPCVKLWESGYVPSFDGKIWRLHGYEGKILWEGQVE